MDLQSYLLAIRRGWWLIVSLAIIGAAVATGLAYRGTPVYAAYVSFYISTPDTSASPLSAGQFAQGRANSYAQLLSSDQLGERIASDTKLALTGHQIAGKISGSVDLNTVLVSATIHDATPGEAIRIATSAAKQFPKMVDQLDNFGSNPDVSLRVVSGPYVGHSPIAPRKKLAAIIGLLIGLLIGLFAAALREVFDTSVRGPDALAEIVGARTLAIIPTDAKASETPLVVDSSGRSSRGEAFRQLRTNLLSLAEDDRVGVTVVTSAVEREGKSTTALNLALVMSQAGRRTLLVEADLRHPQISDYLGLEKTAGLTEVLAGQAQLGDVLQTWGESELSVLVSGALPTTPSEMLSGSAMSLVLSDVRDRFDVVILDAPPLLAVTDAVVLAMQSDGVILVVRDGRTGQAEVTRAVGSLRTVNARILGSVLNRVSASRFRKDPDGNRTFTRLTRSP